MADGGTVWLDVNNITDNNRTPIPEFVKEYGRFAYLEGIHAQTEIHYFSLSHFSYTRDLSQVESLCSYEVHP